jgi:hypothetical protein
VFAQAMNGKIARVVDGYNLSFTLAFDVMRSFERNLKARNLPPSVRVKGAQGIGTSMMLSVRFV